MGTLMLGNVSKYSLLIENLRYSRANRSRDNYQGRASLLLMALKTMGGASPLGKHEGQSRGAGELWAGAFIVVSLSWNG